MSKGRDKRRQRQLGNYFDWLFESQDEATKRNKGQQKLKGKASIIVGNEQMEHGRNNRKSQQPNMSRQYQKDLPQNFTVLVVNLTGDLVNSWTENRCSYLCRL